MKNADAHYRPFMREHNYVKGVNSGASDLVIEMAKIAELVQGDEPEVIAREIYAADISAQGIYKNMVKIHEPELVDGTWVIRKTLTEVGKVAFEALNTGVLWDVHGEKPDYPATTSWYTDMMSKGAVEQKYAELIGNNKSEELRDLRNKLVYFRMRGDRTGDKITAMRDDPEA